MSVLRQLFTDFLPLPSLISICMIPRGKAWIKDWFARQRTLARNGFLAPTTGSSVRLPAAPFRAPNPGVTTVLRDPVSGAGSPAATTGGGGRAGATRLFSPEGGDSSDDTHISTTSSTNLTNGRPLTTQPQPPSITGLGVMPADNLHGLLIAMPGPSITMSTAHDPPPAAARSESVLSLDSVETASTSSLHSHSLGISTSSAFPVTFAAEPGLVPVFAPVGYLDFSTVLANAFPELAHIINLAAASQRRSITIDPALAVGDFPQSDSDPGVHRKGPAFPVSYTTRLYDMIAMARQSTHGTAKPRDRTSFIEPWSISQFRCRQ